MSQNPVIRGFSLTRKVRGNKHIPSSIIAESERHRRETPKKKKCGGKAGVADAKGDVVCGFHGCWVTTLW